MPCFVEVLWLCSRPTPPQGAARIARNLIPRVLGVCDTCASRTSRSALLRRSQSGSAAHAVIEVLAPQPLTRRGCIGFTDSYYSLWAAKTFFEARVLLHFCAGPCESREHARLSADRLPRHRRHRRVLAALEQVRERARERAWRADEWT